MTIILSENLPNVHRLELKTVAAPVLFKVLIIDASSTSLQKERASSRRRTEPTILLAGEVGEPTLVAIFWANTLDKRIFFHSDGERGDEGGRRDEGANSSSEAETTVANFLGKRGKRLLLRPVICSKGENAKKS